MRKSAPPRILENAWIARLAARRLHSGQMAVTLGATIYLWRATRKDFLAQPGWVRHELCHVAQFRRYGWLRFLGLYLWESMLHGYRENAFEREARQAEVSEGVPGPEVFGSC